MSESNLGETHSSIVWKPPSDRLVLREGIWRSQGTKSVSYPVEGNQRCLQIEDHSYWFRHRRNCILSVVRNHPPSGPIYDIGGGNGFMSLALQQAGFETVLVEPGTGAKNGLVRGVKQVIESTLEDAEFHPHSLPAAAAFDVVEHIEADTNFLRDLRRRLIPGGRFYCTVPAGQGLWSNDDIFAGHFRRYSRANLSARLHEAGFQIEFLSPVFLWLTLPVLICRTLPSLFQREKRSATPSPESLRSDHCLPHLLARIVKHVQAWEEARIRTGRPVWFGTSLLCVARSDPNHPLP